MSLPKEITPNPLILTPVEIRFISKAIEGNLFSKLYPVFSTDLPIIENLIKPF